MFVFDAAVRYPANSSDIGDGLNTGGFRFNADKKITKNSRVLRLDLNLNAKQQMFFRANYVDDFQTNAPQFPDTPAPALWLPPYGFAVGHNWTISKNVFNNFRFGLSRDAYTIFGDSSDNQISFANIYSPRRFNRTSAFVTPVYNITDDVTLIRGNHTFQFGANIRFDGNRLLSFNRSYDTAAANPVSYQDGASSITTALQNTFGYQFADVGSVQNGVTAVIGRFSNYTARFLFQREGALQPTGSLRERNFKAEEYDLYGRDVWKFSRNLTFTFGLRYDLSRPIYEAGGYEVKPNVSLSEFFERRALGAINGTPYNEPIVLDLSGKANGKSPLYKTDTNNFQPRIAFAWSPNFGKNSLGWLFGRNNESVIRGGFAITNDHLAQTLAVRYEQANTVGFTQSSPQVRTSLINVNQLAPLFTGFNQTVRNLPFLILPVGNLTFPVQAAVINRPTAIVSGFDENLVSPINYSWNLTYERTLSNGLIVSVSYLGRKARNLLQ